MRYDIEFAPEAVEDLNELKSNVYAEVVDAIELHLRHEPTKTSKSRIKRLREITRPQYRLRVGDDIRVFYNVIEETVEVVAIVRKSAADAWLEKHGESDEEGSTV